MTTSFPAASGQATVKRFGLAVSISGLALLKQATASVCSLNNCLYRFASCALFLMLGTPYDIPIGNFERRAIVSTSCLLTAVLNVSQKVSMDSTPVSSRIRDRVVIVFIVVQ